MFGRIVAKRRLPAGTWFVVLLTLVAVAGCSRGQPRARDVKLSDVGRLSALVAEVADATETSERFQSLFAEGAAPPAGERSKYGPPMMFKLVGDPEISGDTATLTVDVVKVDEKTEEEQVVDQVKWTAVQKGQNWWVLKTAPLP